MSDAVKAKLRSIPSIDKLLDLPAIQVLIAQTSHTYIRNTVRLVVEDIREEMRSGSGSYNGEITIEIQNRLQQRIDESSHAKLRPVINATGVVIHTNLGRAPLAEEAIRSISEVAARYSNLEYDLPSGRRGNRDSNCEELLCHLTGAESAVVVNNNAAAVYLALHEIARGGEVIISRGELVEIGGGFRIPEVIERSGAVLREVGTTNKTRVSDFESVINEKTKAILRVHPSNFRIVGFTDKPLLADLVSAANRAGVPCIEDLGSGCLVPPVTIGLRQEPNVAASIDAGVQIVTFSGDKLLGGPQAGIIAGKREWIDRIRRNPMMRALRVDKLTYAALEATLRLYSQGRESEIPIIKMLRCDSKTLLDRARRLIAATSARETASGRYQIGQLSLTVGESMSVAGGGSAPASELHSFPIEVIHNVLSAAEIESRLRSSARPIISRVENDKVLIDLRTVIVEEEPEIVSTLTGLAQTTE